MIAEDLWDLTNGSSFVSLRGVASGVDVILKMEGLNPAGSIKLKTAREMVRAAEASGRIRHGSELIESTSGSLGIALAIISAARGYVLTLVTDPNTSDRTVHHMRALGARIVVVKERDANGGFLQRRIDYIQDRLAQDENLVWLNQYANPANVEAHRRNTITEILNECGTPDWLFVGAGTTGTLMGCVEGLRARESHTQIVAVDSVGSVTFDAPPQPRYIPGLGTSRRPEIFTDHDALLKVLIPEADTVRMCRRIAAERGLLVGGSTGTVLAAVAGLADRIEPGSLVLAISPDLGERYLDTIYNDVWVVSRLGEGALATSVPPSPRVLTDFLALGGVRA
ncbi:2,3-diaminopropionate biosynthesis protein SbnA [Micromonospora peucetia]|uniref:2,3-diaminopropionate biosynthesis protein SbnA n=1 Tax=Micromonospora peucetia TaxID=47871 RepID=UPI00331D1E2D